MSWQKVKLGEIADCSLGKMLDHKKNVGELHPYLANFNVQWGRIDLSEVGEMPFKPEELKRYKLEKGDLLVCEGGESGRCAMWNGQVKDMMYQKALHRLRVKSGLCSSGYLYFWFLCNGKSDYFRQFTTGATILHLPLQNLVEISVSLPPLPIQRKIADVLGVYDELIENNRKRIALLEKMARELYRERFVRRSRKGYPKALANFCTVQYGYAFNSKEFNAGGQGLPIVRIRNIPQGASTDYTTEKAPEEYIVHDGELLVGMDGEFHINLWSGGDAYLVQRSCCFRPYDESVKGFLMEAIRAPIKYFESSAMGATVGHLGKKDIDTISLYEPTDEENALFNEMYKERLSLSLQSRILARQRDRLLPRLMSGKIDVEKLAKEGK